MAPIDVVAIMQPKSGKADRVQDILATAAAAVKENEPGTLRYHLQRESKGDSPVFVMLETYADQKALAAHGSSDAFKEMVKTFKKEDLLAVPMKIHFTKEVGGFKGRL